MRETTKHFGGGGVENGSLLSIYKCTIIKSSSDKYMLIDRWITGRQNFIDYLPMTLSTTARSTQLPWGKNGGRFYSMMRRY